MRIIGVDPGTLKLGWGVLQREGTKVRHVAHGVLKLEGELADRLVMIDQQLTEVIATHEPSHAAVESMFFAKHAQSAVKLGHARGVVMVCLRRAGLELAEFPPARIKRAIAGHGRAGKRQVQQVVGALLALPELPPEDASDALAAAFT